METLLSNQTIVLDSSIMVLWFQGNHPKRNKALKIRQLFIEERLHILVPDLAIHEVQQALKNHSSFKSEQIELAVQSLYNMELEILTMKPFYLTRAFEISISLLCSLPPAYYMAIAEYHKCYYWTADHDFYAKASEFHVVRFL